ncbi:MAG: tRNA lysidine(34) synthetase TilS [Bacteroidetes bacterium]|nr:tRNA lysidine(34) synthetase TilS [Bacteroidota bacterium]
MFKQFKRYISAQKLFTRKDKILLTVSGGLDSVVMCELFYQSGLQFGIAHCNFLLRGQESDLDEIFVKDLASKYNVPFHVNHFQTIDFASEKNVSIQMAARQLRYDWFEELVEAEKYQYYATAHHQNDEIETFFINLLRGTGIAGLHGILPKQNHLIRPLLFTCREKIEKFANELQLKHREDSSNSSEKYLRNAIRHNIIPQFKYLTNDFERIMIENIEKIRETEIIFNEMLEIKRKEIVNIENSKVLLNIEKLLALYPVKIYLYHFLSPFGFNNETIESLILSLNEISGKQFFSPTHRLLKDRENLIITEIDNDFREDEVYYIKEDDIQIFNPIILEFRITTESEMIKINPDKNLAYLDFDKLKFPLYLRKWQYGDFFFPFGMNGKKKVSDFFTDQKFSIIDKENTWLLCSGDNIVWVVGWRIDEHYRLTTKTHRGYIIELKKSF